MPPDIQVKQTNPLQYVILDTNIIQYSVNFPSSNAFRGYFSDLMNRGFGLAISQISGYEILRNKTIKQENEVFEFLNVFNNYYVSAEVLLTAARLYNFFRNEGVFKTNISDGDVIIAATSIWTNSLILTRNRGDFPYPFFLEVEVVPLSFIKSTGHSDCYTIALLKPNAEFITDKINNRK
jgi:predicted nucleic acid-binding protein